MNGRSIGAYCTNDDHGPRTNTSTRRQSLNAAASATLSLLGLASNGTDCARNPLMRSAAARAAGNHSYEGGALAARPGMTGAKDCPLARNSAIAVLPRSTEE